MLAKLERVLLILNAVAQEAVGRCASAVDAEQAREGPEARRAAAGAIVERFAQCYRAGMRDLEVMRARLEAPAV